jgi:hypothetical protein
MDKNDLKTMWNEAHKTSKEDVFDIISIQKSLSLNHCKSISKVLTDFKLKILVWITSLAFYIGLILYALVYLDLDLSIYSLLPLALVGLFFLIKTTSEIIRFLILTKTTDNMSVKDSFIFFRKKLIRIGILDFLSYLVFLYLTVILIIINYLSDIGGIKNLSWSNEILPVPLLGIIIIMLLLLPWFIKYEHNKRYKKLYSNLNYSINLLNRNT